MFVTDGFQVKCWSWRTCSARQSNTRIHCSPQPDLSLLGGKSGLYPCTHHNKHLCHLIISQLWKRYTNDYKLVKKTAKLHCI